MKAWEALRLAKVNEPSVKIVYKLTERLIGVVEMDMGQSGIATEAEMIFGNWDVVSLNARDGFLEIAIEEPVLDEGGKDI